MIERVLTIPRGFETTMAVVGVCSGVVLARVGFFGVAAAGPMMILIGIVAGDELGRRQLPSAVMAYFAATAAAAWLLW
jgi:hypothetical protein